MGFITLTLDKGESVHVNADKIYAMYVNDYNHTVVAFNNDYTIVTETPEEIMEMIKNDVSI